MRWTISWSLLATVYWSRDEDGTGWSNVFAGVCPWMYIGLLRPSFIKGQASSCKRYSYRERVWYWNQDRWHWSTLYSDTQGDRNGRKN